MLRSLDTIRGFEAHGTEGRLGILRDVSFDSRDWTIHHLVLATTRFFGANVSLGTDSVVRIDPQVRRVFFQLGTSAAEGGIPSTVDESQLWRASAPPLIRTDDLRHFPISAPDEKSGRIDDYVFDDQSWSIRYLVIESGPWPKRTWLVAPPTAVRMDWDAQKGTLGWRRPRQATLA